MATKKNPTKKTPAKLKVAIGGGIRHPRRRFNPRRPKALYAVRWIGGLTLRVNSELDFGAPMIEDFLNNGWDIYRMQTVGDFICVILEKEEIEMPDSGS